MESFLLMLCFPKNFTKICQDWQFIIMFELTYESMVHLSWGPRFCTWNFISVFLEPDLWWFVLQCNTDTIKVEPNSSEDEAHRSHDEPKDDTEPDHSQDFTHVGVKCEVEVGQFQNCSI
jgi:hypothetical protein